MVPIHKNPVYIALFIAMTLCYLSQIARAQNVTRNGNTFTLVDSAKGQDTKTDYLFRHENGVDTVYLSSTGKAFVWKVSKKTGKRYKKYVPEIGKQINPDAYASESARNRQ